MHIPGCAIDRANAWVSAGLCICEQKCVQKADLCKSRRLAATIANELKRQADSFVELEEMRPFIQSDRMEEAAQIA